MSSTAHTSKPNFSRRQQSLDALPKRSARFIYTLPSNHPFHWPDFIFLTL